MKPSLSLAALLVVSLAAAASNAHAQGSAPGARSPHRDRVTAVPPPPPPPRGLDKRANIRPWDPRGFDSGVPKLVDEFARRPGTKASTCHAVDITFGNCAASLLGTCVTNNGDFSCTDDSCTCTYE